jgi:hypothetical protein
LKPENLLQWQLPQHPVQQCWQRFLPPFLLLKRQDLR